MNTINCDVLVVGAGPAGSSAAREAALRGADTLLLDRREVVGSPVQCAEYVPAQLVGELGMGRDFVAQPIDGMKTFLPDGSEHTTSAKGFVINRDQFDQRLCRAVTEAGAGLLLGTRVLRRENGVVLACTRGKCEPSLAVRAKVVIGADGPRSTVGSWVGAVNANLLSGVQFTLPLTGPERFTEIYFEPEIFAGYAWFFPKNDRVNIGLGMHTRADAASPRDLLVRFKDRFVAQGRVEDVILSRAGGCIPAEPVRSAVHGDVLLAGDAAGHTHPITGAGIFSAVTCGRLAGEYAARAARNNDLSLLAGYDDEWRDLFEDSLSRAASRRMDMESNWSDFIPTVRRTWVAFREYYA